MTKIKMARMIAGISIVVGCLVIVGWYLDITILTSILPQWIRMKFATAISFIFSGIIIIFLSLKKESWQETRRIILTIFPMLLVLVMGTLFLGSIFGFQTGMENIAFVDVHELNTPIFQGRPSVATMICFLLIACVGVLYNFNRSTKTTFCAFGSIIAVIGSVGLIGYIVNQPFFYYEIPGFSNAIAIHTTILFALLGASIYLIGREQEHDL